MVALLLMATAKPVAERGLVVKDDGDLDLFGDFVSDEVNYTLMAKVFVTMLVMVVTTIVLLGKCCSCVRRILWWSLKPSMKDSESQTDLLTEFDDVTVTRYGKRYHTNSNCRFMPQTRLAEVTVYGKCTNCASLDLAAMDYL